MAKLRIVKKDIKDEFNEDLIVHIDGKKIENLNEMDIDSGKHFLEIEQFHTYNNKYFLLSPLMMLYAIVASSSESAYLLRRWGKIALLKCHIYVGEQGGNLNIDLERKRLGILMDSYIISIEIGDFTKTSFEFRNIKTIIGTIMFFIYLLSILLLVIFIFK